MKNKFKIAIHTIGLSSLTGASFLSILTFYFIQTKNYAKFIEPNLLIRDVETVTAVFGMIYIFYLFYLMSSSKRFKL